MKQVEINLYCFGELSDEAKQTALDEMRDINVDYNWWEFLYEDFEKVAACFGITVNLKKTYFSGFYHQGQGSSYTADIDVLKMLDCIKGNLWKQYAPEEEFNFSYTIDERIVDLIRREFIDVWASVQPVDRCTTLQLLFYANYFYNACESYDNIDSQLSRLEELTKDVCNELNHFLFKSLLNNYDYLTSDEAVRETIECNDYPFTTSGKPASFLLRIAGKSGS